MPTYTVLNYYLNQLIELYSFSILDKLIKIGQPEIEYQ